MFKNKNSEEQKTTKTSPTILSSTMNIVGDLVCVGDIKVDGHITGNINTMGRVIIGETGCVFGDIRATEVIIKGTVQGKLECAGTLTLFAPAIVKGNLLYNEVVIEEGVDLAGNLDKVDMEEAKRKIEQKTMAFKENRTGARGLQLIKSLQNESVKFSTTDDENDNESNMEKIGWG